jgi:O-antigen/teichoic acid export membrane protein
MLTREQCWSLSVQVIPVFFATVLVSLQTRILDTSAYGSVTLAVTFAMLAQVYLFAGIANAATRFLPAAIAARNTTEVMVALW